MWRQRGWVSLLLSALVAAAAAGDPSSAAAPASPPAAATASPPAAANATVAPSAASAPPAADKPPSTAICQACVCDAASGLVDCSHKEMEDHFPDPADWKDLGFDPIEVRFDENMLVHVRPFAKLDKLKKLSMSHNHIAKIDDQAFQNLSSIEEIDLSHNHLTSEELSPHIFQGYYAPEQYEPLKKMRVLRLGSNALHSLHPDFFEHLPGLEELYLDSNPFKVIDRNTHSAITSIAYLKVLDLSRTSIGKLPEHFLHTPRYLEKLVLAGNMFPEPPEGLRDSHALLSLDMSENPFSVIRSVPAMANLTTLVISHCPDLTEIGQEALALLPALSRLYLHSNPRLVTIHPAALESPPEPPAETHVWPPVTTLDLHDNALGYLESTLVGRWDQMKEIRLDGNPWVCDCDNQWMIETLLPTLERMDPKFGVGLTCAAPEEMKHQSLRKLQATHYHMRCLDAYGNEPEHDTPILVGVLVGVLLAAPATLALVLLWRRLPGFKRRRAAGDYSRAFYKPAETEPDLF